MVDSDVVKHMNARGLKEGTMRIGILHSPFCVFIMSTISFISCGGVYKGAAFRPSSWTAEKMQELAPDRVALKCNQVSSVWGGYIEICAGCKLKEPSYFDSIDMQTTKGVFVNATITMENHGPKVETLRLSNAKLAIEGLAISVAGGDSWISDVYPGMEGQALIQFIVHEDVIKQANQFSLFLEYVGEPLEFIFYRM
jgi:hypothetical protein